MTLVTAPSGSGQDTPAVASRQEIRNTVGANLRRLREAMGWTQAQLGAKAGLGGRDVSFFETGRRTPCAWNLVRLCRALGAASDEVLGMRKPLPPFWEYQDEQPAKVDVVPVDVAGTAANDGVA